MLTSPPRGRFLNLFRPKFTFLLGCLELFPSNFDATTMDPAFSGKMRVLDYLLAVTKQMTDDKFVLVSNYTETLDVFAEVVLSFPNLPFS